jgi:hypothetical protein
MKKIAVQRLAVLIDTDNIEIEARKTYNCRVNYDALFRAMNGREVVRALYYRPRACSPRLQAFLENHLGPIRITQFWYTPAYDTDTREETATAPGGGE